MMSADAPTTTDVRRDWAWLAIVTGVAAVLRFYHLGAWSFWADEIFTLRDARGFPGTLTMNPLTYACVAACIKLFGVSEWSARLAPALAGVACAPLAYWAGRRLFSMWTGRAAALIVALSPWHLFWSQNARHYVFTFMFALVALVAFHEAMRETGAWWAAAALAATVGVGLSHTPAGAFVLGPACYCLMKTARRRAWATEGRRPYALLVYFGPMAVTGLVVLLVPALRSYVVAGWGRNAWARSVPYIVMTYVHGVTLPVVAAAVVGAYGARPWPSGRLLTVCGLVAPSAFFLVASLAQNVPGYYLFFTAACAILLAGNACAWAITANPKAGVLALSILCAALLGQDVMYHTAEQGGRAPWRQALATLRDEAGPEDAVYMLLPEIGEHYLQPSAERRPPAIRRLTSQLMARPDDLRAPDGGAAYVVVDMRSMATLDPGGDFVVWLTRSGTRVARVAAYARGSDRTIEAYRLLERLAAK
jgi:mannosyltransferase